MKLLTNELQKSYQNSKIYHICTETYICKDKHAQGKKSYKVRDHSHYTREYRGASYSICNLKHSVPKEIRIVFHNRSNNDYYFIITELAEQLGK